MNNYIKIFLTIALLTALGYGLSRLFEMLSVADTMFNVIAVLGITASILFAYWCIHQLWIKPMKKDPEKKENSPE